MQSLSGSVPSAIEPHVPSTPLPFLAALQAWQVPVQGLSQHTLSTQLALAHCVLVVHAAPGAWSGTQAAVLTSQ